MPDSDDPMSFLARLFGGGAPTMTPHAFVAERDASAPVLDVRTPKEFATGHLRGAVNADVLAADFAARVERLKLPADGPVYVCCASGMRSGKAAARLRTMGHAGAVNVGGVGALRAAGAK